MAEQWSKYVSKMMSVAIPYSIPLLDLGLAERTGIFLVHF